MTETMIASANDNSAAPQCCPALKRLDGRLSLLIVLVLSLGLWVAIWMTLAYLIRWALGW